MYLALIIIAVGNRLLLYIKSNDICLNNYRGHSEQRL